VFGPGVLSEAGEHARTLGMKRAALFTDKRVGALQHVADALASLRSGGIDVAVYDEVKVEPTDESFRAAARFAAEGRFDGYVSVGGGSVIDTCKAANLYSTHPAEFLDYVNAPIGAGKPVPGPLRPHIACPTTCGTGSECTGIAVFDLLAKQVKTGIASKRLKPSLALVDPTTTYSLPKNVVAASGFDVLSHALESYTARPYTMRAKGAARPMSQGANPWSDVGCEAAMRKLGTYLVRAVNDASDREARDNLMFAASKIGEPMTVAMRPDEAKQWFGVAPPDLSVIARARGADWLYTYLRTFYRDPKTTTGWNNAVFPQVAMPHALWSMQGERAWDAEKKVWTQLSPGTHGTVQYDAAVRDLVNFLVYMGEPNAINRKIIGIVVLFVLGLLFILAYALKKEYWRDVK